MSITSSMAVVILVLYWDPAGVCGNIYGPLVMSTISAATFALIQSWTCTREMCRSVGSFLFWSEMQTLAYRASNVVGIVVVSLENFSLGAVNIYILTAIYIFEDRNIIYHNRDLSCRV